MNRRPPMAGFSVPEAVLALLLGLFVVHLGLSTLARLRTSQGRLAAQAEGLTAMRVARHVLRDELRRGTPGRDWFVSDDSISLRAFRGVGLVCPLDSASTEVTVSFTGQRRADPSKDSVLFLDPLGSVEVRSLAGVGPAVGPCGPEGLDSLERWSLDAPVPHTAVVGRLFEHGSYHVALSALRYRRGESGRQPLTPEVWDGTSGWVLSPAAIGLQVQHQNADAGPSWSAFLAENEPQ